LLNGLQTFGIGAKTASGYGWFEEVGGERNDISNARKASQNVIAENIHPVVRNWKGKTQSEANFRIFRPELAKIKDDEELRKVFHEIMPEVELRKLTKKNRYWQSFTSHPDGVAILKRCGLLLK
jgi:predicted AAA+ superfamily ATPase